MPSDKEMKKDKIAKCLRKLKNSKIGGTDGVVSGTDGIVDREC